MGGADRPAGTGAGDHRPADWQDLVARFPRDVTGTHDGQWRYWGGVPGPWRLPDWEQVMGHYDGVHVSIGAAVASCGVALSAAGGVHHARRVDAGRDTLVA